MAEERKRRIEELTRKNWFKHAEAYVTQKLATTSLELVRFVDWNGPFIQDVPIVETLSCECILDRKRQEVIDWITGILSKENIKGEWLIRFRTPFDSKGGRPTTQVLIKDYEWIKDIWSDSDEIDLVSIDRIYFIEIFRPLHPGSTCEVNIRKVS